MHNNFFTKIISIFRHEKYTHPSVVLSPNVSLMGINKRFAIFAVCDKSINVFNHKIGPFLYINQLSYCTHLIRIPLKFFVRLGEHIEDLPSKRNFVLLSNVGRCGSTLLTQLFEDTPNSVAISEPEVLMEFSHEKTFDNLTDQQRHILLQTCIRFLLNAAKDSKEDSKEIENFLIKPKAHGISIGNDLCQLYPNMKHLYMYRHPAEYVRSIRSLYHSLLPKFVYKLLSIPIVYNLMTSDSLGMNMREYMLRHIEPRCQKNENNNFRMKILSALEIFNVESEHHLVERFGVMYCANLLSIQDIATKGYSKIEVVSYHELKNYTALCMKRIYQFCNIKPSAKEDSHFRNELVTGLPQYDSQANSPISQTKLKSFQNALNEKDIATLNKILQYCGAPTCATFPLESDNFISYFPIIKSISPAITPCSSTSKKPFSNYTMLAEEKGATKSGISLKYYQPSYNEIQPFQASNKSIWFPINRIF